MSNYFDRLFAIAMTKLTRHRGSTEHSLTFRVRSSHYVVISRGGGKLVGLLEFNVPFQHKYGYIRVEGKIVTTVPVMLP